MWILYALAAALLWGISYAAGGRVIARGFSPLSFFFLYSLFGAILGGTVLSISGRIAQLPGELRTLDHDLKWFLIAMLASAVGTLLIFLAIAGKNATLASLIEISYPFFVALFAWLFFRDVHFNWPTALGGLLILSGVAVVFYNNK